jgi:hypothetical protein
MAKLIIKDYGHFSFGCYSERGILSYCIFRYLPYDNNLQKFLRSFEFPDGVQNPFVNDKVDHATFFSELDFGSEGFGSPDGALLIKFNNNNKCMIFIESKINETYVKSCQNKNRYNSTIRGQLELRWRVISLYKLHFEEAIQLHRGIQYLREIESYRTFYQNQNQAQGNDTFYQSSKRQDLNKISSWRRLRLIGGVGEIFNDYIGECNMEDIYFLTISKDKINPFNDMPEDLRPRLIDKHWDNVKRNFCWVCSEKIEQLQE